MRTAMLTLSLLLSLTVHATEPDIEQLIRTLGAERFATRQNAQQQLTALAQQRPQDVLPVAVHHYATTPDPEIRARLYEVMSNVVHQAVLGSARGYLGIRLQPVFPLEERADVPPTQHPQILIVGVLDNSPAAKAGLLPGMGILKLDDETFHGPNAVENFRFAIRIRNPGTTVRLHVRDGDDLRVVPVTLEPMPPELEQELNLPALAKRYFEMWLNEQLQQLQRPATTAPIDNPTPAR